MEDTFTLQNTHNHIMSVLQCKSVFHHPRSKLFLENVFVLIEILFKMLLFKGGVLIYAEHCIYTII